MDEGAFRVSHQRSISLADVDVSEDEEERRSESGVMRDEVISEVSTRPSSLSTPALREEKPSSSLGVKLDIEETEKGRRGSTREWRWAQFDRWFLGLGVKLASRSGNTLWPFLAITDGDRLSLKDLAPIFTCFSIGDFLSDFAFAAITSPQRKRAFHLCQVSLNIIAWIVILVTSNCEMSNGGYRFLMSAASLLLGCGSGAAACLFLIMTAEDFKEIEKNVGFFWTATHGVGHFALTSMLILYDVAGRNAVFVFLLAVSLVYLGGLYSRYEFGPDSWKTLPTSPKPISSQMVLETIADINPMERFLQRLKNERTREVRKLNFFSPALPSEFLKHTTKAWGLPGAFQAIGYYSRNASRAPSAQPSRNHSRNPSTYDGPVPLTIPTVDKLSGITELQENTLNLPVTCDEKRLPDDEVETVQPLQWTFKFKIYLVFVFVNSILAEYDWIALTTFMVERYDLSGSIMGLLGWIQSIGIFLALVYNIYYPPPLLYSYPWGLCALMIPFRVASRTVAFWPAVLPLEVMVIFYVLSYVQILVVIVQTNVVSLFVVEHVHNIAQANAIITAITTLGAIVGLSTIGAILTYPLETYRDILLYSGLAFIPICFAMAFTESNELLEPRENEHEDKLGVSVDFHQGLRVAEDLGFENAGYDDDSISASEGNTSWRKAE